LLNAVSILRAKKPARKYQRLIAGKQRFIRVPAETLPRFQLIPASGLCQAIFAYYSGIKVNLKFPEVVSFAGTIKRPTIDGNIHERNMPNGSPIYPVMQEGCLIVINCNQFRRHQRSRKTLKISKTGILKRPEYGLRIRPNFLFRGSQVDRHILRK